MIVSQCTEHGLDSCQCCMLPTSATAPLRSFAIGLAMVSLVDPRNFVRLADMRLGHTHEAAVRVQVGQLQGLVRIAPLEKVLDSLCVR